MSEVDASEGTTAPRSRRLGTDGEARRQIDAPTVAEAVAKPIRGRAEVGRIIQAARLTAITEFCAAVTHDLHQPVSAVVTNVHTALRWLNRPTPNLDELRLALERIMRDADGIQGAIAQARAPLAQAKPAAKPFDVNRLMLETLALMNGDADKARVRVETALDYALPAMTADPALLQQAAINLISNALDAMGDVNDRLRVLRLSTRREGPGGIAVSIADTGVGLGQDNPQALFQPFYSTKAQGLGLGLPIARSIIEGCGGRLTAEPNPPHGAVFTFTLPAAASAS